MKIAVLLMVKNEERRVHVTIRSANRADGIIVYDTGSEDRTLEIVAAEATVPVHVRRSAFKDFAASRNESLEFADECGYDYVFLLDANDELVLDANRSRLEAAIVDAGPLCDCWFVERRLKYSVDNYVTFRDAKLLRCHPIMYRYKGVVHEYLDGCRFHVKLDETIASIYQDRTADDDSTQRRWVRDETLLRAELESRPTDARTMFYLAQTLSGLGRTNEAIDMYAKRAATLGGFEEERWQALVQCGSLTRRTDPEKAIEWYDRAVRHTVRAEPLVYAAELLIAMKKYVLAYAYSRLACELDFPSEALLFVERRIYDYDRWHTLGICAYYAAIAVKNDARTRDERLSAGRTACEKAVAAGNNVELDSSNLKFYI